MILIAVLLALGLERLLAQLWPLGEPVLLRRAIVDLHRHVNWAAYWRSSAAAFLPVIVGMLAVHLVDRLITGPLLDLVFSVLVLLLCLGPRDLGTDIERLISAREQGDARLEDELTASLLVGPDRRHTKRSLIGALFIQSHERLFGVLLWFFLLGPVGAVAYRIASRQPRFLRLVEPGSRAEQAAVLLHAVLAWLPARLTALLYMLSGSTDSALDGWRRVAANAELPWCQRTWATLAETAAGALAVESAEGAPAVDAELENCLREVLALQNRALLVLLAAFAMFTTGGWIAG